MAASKSIPHWNYSKSYFANTYREIKDNFRQLEKLEYSGILQEEAPLLDTIQKLRDLPGCCRFPSHLKAFQVFAKFVLSVPSQLQGLLEDLRYQYEGFGESDGDNSDYREDSVDGTDYSVSDSFEDEDRDFDITKTKNSIVWPLVTQSEEEELEDEYSEQGEGIAEDGDEDEGEGEGHMEIDGNYHDQDENFKIQLEVRQTQLERMHADLQLVEDERRRTMDKRRQIRIDMVANEDVQDAEEELESSSNEDPDEDSEDNLQAEIDDLSSIHNEYADENSENSLEMNFQDLRSSPISSEAAKESLRLHTVDTLPLHLEPRQGGTELEQRIQKINQLFQEAFIALCPGSHMILCREHTPWKKEPQSSTLKRKNDTDGVEDRQNLTKRFCRMTVSE